MNVYEKIAAQQTGKTGTAAWMVGQQLRDILAADPTLEEIVNKDLDVDGMDLEHCAERIKAKADELHKQTNSRCVCITPDVAEGIIREFYGLPTASKASPVAVVAPVLCPPAASSDPDEPELILDFADLL